MFAGPKMVAVRNYHGTPTPPGKVPLCFQTGDYMELLKGGPDTSWWEVRVCGLHRMNLLRFGLLFQFGFMSLPQCNHEYAQA